MMDRKLISERLCYEEKVKVHDLAKDIDILQHEIHHKKSINVELQRLQLLLFRKLKF